MSYNYIFPPFFTLHIYPVQVTDEQELRDFLDACVQSGLVVNYNRTIPWCKPWFERRIPIYLRCEDDGTISAFSRPAPPSVYYKACDLRVELPSSCEDILDLL